MEFMVRMEISIPHEMTPEQLADLQFREHVRGRELRDEGILRRVWRVPGRYAALSLWDAQDASTLHDALRSMPLWPYMDVSVDALAQHPQERFDDPSMAGEPVLASAGAGTRAFERGRA